MQKNGLGGLGAWDLRGSKGLRSMMSGERIVSSEETEGAPGGLNHVGELIVE